MYRSLPLFGIAKILAIFFFFLGAVSCQTTENATSQNSGEEPEEEATDDRSDMEEKYWAQIQESRESYTEADVDFMLGMIGHHAQALIMSDLAPENDASDEIKRLAARITNAQKDEISTMQQWLKDRGEPVPEVHIDGLELMLHGIEDGHQHMDHENMPGMLSPQQLEELQDARGSEFDRLFLKYMIEHHEGAVIMVRNLFDTDGAAQDEEAFRLASDIQVDQITEIERMELMLEEMSES